MKTQRLKTTDTAKLCPQLRSIRRVCHFAGSTYACMHVHGTCNPLSLACILWNIEDPDQTPQNQDLHCLLTESSIRILIKMMKNTTQQPLKQKWNGLIDNSGKFHSA